MPAGQRTIEHIDQLVNEIGPRGATTLREARAAGYAGQVLEAAGLEPRLQIFRATPSASRPYLAWAALAILSLALPALAGRAGIAAALILSLIATILIYLEMSHRPNPLRRLLPRRLSQNIHTLVLPVNRPRRQVVLVANLDSRRLPLPFAADRWLAPLTILAGLALFALFGLALVAPRPNWPWLALILAIVVWVQFTLALLAGRVTFSRGANDNASGVALLLSTAERLVEEPLQHTAVRFVFTGCKTVGGYGAQEFVKAHLDQLDGALWLTVDGAGGPGEGAGYATNEALPPFVRSDPELMAQAREVAEQRPELGVQPVRLVGVLTESAVAAQHGFRLLTVTSRQGSSRSPQSYSWQIDGPANVNPETLKKSENFVWALLQTLDGQSCTAVDELAQAELEEEE